MRKPSTGFLVVFIIADIILLFIAIIVSPQKIFNALQPFLQKFQPKEVITKTEPICKDCNVILVSLDTLSANHLPCYGYDRDTSPVLCKFASQNILFKNMYANSTWTLPSHVSIFTGLYANVHKVIDRGDKLDKSVPLMPQLLQKNGYKTIFLSPEGDYTIPLKDVYNRGIDNFIDEADVNTSWPQALDLFKKNIEAKKKTFLFLHTYSVHELYLIGDAPKLYTDKSFPNIPTKYSEIDEQSPEYYNFMEKKLNETLKDKNTPTNVLGDYKKMYDIVKKYKYDPEKLRQELDPYDSYLYYFMYLFNYKEKLHLSNPAEIDYIRALYDQGINQMDESIVTKLINFVNDPEIMKNTIVIITADHGEEFMEHGEISHSTAFDSNIKIPLIMSVPGISKPISIDDNVQSVDILPTTLTLLGLPLPQKLNGNNLAPLLTGIPAENMNNRILVSDSYKLQYRVLRKGDWTLFARTDGSVLEPYELYNTKVDPGQKNNLYIGNSDTAKAILKEYLNNLGDQNQK